MVFATSLVWEYWVLIKGSVRRHVLLPLSSIVDRAVQLQCIDSHCKSIPQISCPWTQVVIKKSQETFVSIEEAPDMQTLQCVCVCVLIVKVFILLIIPLKSNEKGEKHCLVASVTEMAPFFSLESGLDQLVIMNMENI